MVYNTQNYWVYGRCPSSGIPESRKHDVSETESVSVQISLGPLEVPMIEVSSF
jgi:hypothetical protein